jgi:hypothetical protein
MNIRDIIWREEVEDKIIRKHGVWPDEAEQVLANTVRTFALWNTGTGQAKIRAYGQSKR